MTKITLLTMAVLGLLAGSAHGQLSSRRMMKIVMRDTSPDVPPNSFGAHPKTLYRLGKTYGRMEETPDAEHRIHGLIIIAEPKLWMIYLWDRAGRLVIDPESPHECHVPIVPGEGKDQKSPLPGFEFGQEYAFLRSRKAMVTREVIQGKDLEVFSLSLNGYKIKLLSVRGRERPTRLTVVRAGKLVCQFDYDEYDPNLPVRMELFAPPKNVKITETEKP